MKRIYIIGLLSLLCQMSTYSKEITKEYQISIDTSRYCIVTDSSGLSLIKGPDFYLDDSISPCLPYIQKKILLPYNTEVRSYSLIYNNSVVWKDNIDLRSNPMPIPTDLVASSKKIAHRAIYSKAIIYPTKNILYDCVVKKGFVIANIYVTPFVYDATTKRISIASSMSIQLNLAEKPSVSSAKIDNTIKNKIKETVINPQEVNSYSLSNDIQLKSVTLETETGTDKEYLIITNNALKSTFQKLVQWKIRKGVSAEVVTVEDIYSTVSGSTPQMKIKQYLADAWGTKQKLKWVLLGGDDAIVPAQGCYVNYFFQYSNAPTDLFYACLQGRLDWNANGNTLIGEFDKETNPDSVNYLPDILISRAPVRTVIDATSFINKTLSYELTPGTNNYIGRNLAIGDLLYDYFNGKSDAHISSEMMFDSVALDPTTSIGDSFPRIRFYDTGTDFLGNADYDVNTYNMQTQLNTGYHLAHIYCHGESSVFGYLEDSTLYSVDNALALKNINKSIIVTGACTTNSFDSKATHPFEPCLSEAFIRNPNGGAIAYWGSSREGWSAEGGYGASLRYDEYFLKKLYSNSLNYDDHTLGYIASEAKEAAFQRPIGANRFLLYCINVMGDPELPIYTATPSSFSSATVTKSGDTVTVNSGGVSGCRIAVTSEDMGESYFDVRENVSSATFTNVTMPYSVCITKFNYKPYVKNTMWLNCPVELTASSPTNTCSIYGLPTGATVSYSSSNPNLVSCTPLSGGQATVTYNTMYSGYPSAHMDTITATISYGGSIYTFSKEINIIGTTLNARISNMNETWVGNKVLDSIYTVGSGYKLTIDGALLCCTNAKIIVATGGTLCLTNNAKVKLAPISGVSSWQGIEVTHSSNFSSIGYVEKYPNAELELQPGPVTKTLRYTGGSKVDSLQVCLNDVITSRVSWENPMIILSPGLRIAPGGVLTIHNTVKVKENARIDVLGKTDYANGGELNIGNAKITSLTEAPWEGIFAVDPGSRFNFYNAIIEKANYGLSALQQADLMKIEHSFFKQCNNAITLSNSNYSDATKYYIKTTAFTNNVDRDINLSGISTLNLTDNTHSLLNGNNSGAIKISNSTGINVTGGSMKYLNGTNKRKGIGVKIENSTVQFNGTGFENFMYGIKSANTSTSTNTLGISSCVFTENKRGVDLSYGGTVSMNSNTFTIPVVSADTIYGAVLNNISNYTIAQNYFNCTTSSNLNIGLAISNSGTSNATKLVTNNTFENTYFGCVVNGANRSGYNHYGLIFTCNVFTGTSDAIRVVRIPGQTNQGIDCYLISATEPNFNKYYSPGDNALNFMTGVGVVRYYCDQTDPSQVPMQRVSTNPLIYSATGNCPCSAPDGANGSLSSNETMEPASLLMTAASSTSETLKTTSSQSIADDYYELEKQIDNGETETSQVSSLNLDSKDQITEKDSAGLSEDEKNRWEDLMETKREIKGFETQLEEAQISKLEALVDANPYDRTACWASNVLNNYRDTIVGTVIFLDTPETLELESPDTLQSSIMNKWLKVTPNPSNGRFTLNISDDVYKAIGKKQITISNFSGIVVWQKTLVDHEQSITPDQSFSSGTYTCTLTDASGIISTTTIIVR